jgi:hypothetical protein
MGTPSLGGSIYNIRIGSCTALQLHAIRLSEKKIPARYIYNNVIWFSYVDLFAYNIITHGYNMVSDHLLRQRSTAFIHFYLYISVYNNIISILYRIYIIIFLLWNDDDVCIAWRSTLFRFMTSACTSYIHNITIKCFVVTVKISSSICRPRWFRY